MKKILIVDDEHAICQAFAQMVKREGHQALIASNGSQALHIIEQQQPDAIFMDIQMPGLNGLETLQRLQQQEIHIPTVLMTAFGTMQTAMQAVQQGAFDYLGKPVELDKARQLLRQMLATSMAVSVPPRPDGAQAEPELVGQSAPMQELFKLMGMLTTNDMTTLITGESGVGKELVARGIHRHGLNSDQPFIAVNCAAIPHNLLESELFGHDKGAFSGADSRRIGRCESAGNGTLFLDEIAEIPRALQSKLLRVIQERNFERIGSSTTIKLKARIIAATNRKPEQEIAAGRFREDLYHRLNVITLCVPPLRERREDIPLLAQHFVQQACAELGKHSRPIEDSALQKLQAWHWPGNVRELEHVIKRSVLLVRGSSIAASDLILTPSTENHEEQTESTAITARLNQIAREALRQAVTQASQNDNDSLFHQLIQQVESAIIKEALELCQNNQVSAARLLGLHRSTLRKKISPTDE
jgi:DNA-binding NtrC family response regulator